MATIAPMAAEWAWEVATSKKTLHIKSWVRPRVSLPRLSRAALSLFILVHLFAVFVRPNWEGIWGSWKFAGLEPYLHFFEFTNNWSFYAPDPGTALLHVEWETLGKSENSLSKGRLPEATSPYFFEDRHNRRVSAVRFMLPFDARAEKMMVPYLCKSDSRVYSVRLWRIVEPTPTLMEVKTYQRKLGDGKVMHRQWIAHSFCREYGI